MAKKNVAPSLKKAATKARQKASGTVSYSKPDDPSRMYTPAEARKERQVKRAERAGAAIKSYRYQNAGTETMGIARKVDVDASKPKTAKSSGKTFKATASQMQSDRNRAANRATGIAKREKTKKESASSVAAKKDKAMAARRKTRG